MGVRLIKISSAIAFVSIVVIGLIGVLKFIVFPSLDGRDISILDNGGTRIELGGRFVFPVSLSGNLLVVDSFKTTFHSPDSCGITHSRHYGIAHFFQKQLSGRWRLVRKVPLTPFFVDPPYSHSYPARSISLASDGTVMAVSDHYTNAHRGAVHLFEKRLGIWWQWAHRFSSYITNDSIEENNPPPKTVVDLDGNDLFGTAVSLSADGTLLAVGAVGDKDGNGRGGGVVPAYHRASDVIDYNPSFPFLGPKNTQKIFNTILDYAGVTVSACSPPPRGVVRNKGVGHHRPESKNGAAYLFEKQSDGEWQQVHKFSDHTANSRTTTRFTTAKTDVDLYHGDGFGGSVSLSGNLLAVGAYNDDDGYHSAGAVYLFERQTNGTWSQVHKLSNHTTSNNGRIRFTAEKTDVDLYQGDGFGVSVSLSGNLLAVGAVDANDSKGEVYLFEKRLGGKWRQKHKFFNHTISTVAADRFTATRTDVDLEQDDKFGGSVSLSGNLLAVGAVGAAYLFPL